MLTEIRRRAGLTTPELASMLGVHPSTAYAWESGRRKPRTSQLTSILGALGAVASDGVGDLMPHDDAQAVQRFRYRNDARVHSDFAARQTESVRLRRIDDVELPVKPGVVRLGGLSQAPADRLHLPYDLARCDDTRLGQDLLIRLQS